MIRCNNCQNYLESVQIASDTWTRELCLVNPHKLFQFLKVCSLHKAKEYPEFTEFIKEDEMTI